MRRIMMTVLGLALVVPAGALAQQRGMRRPMGDGPGPMGPPPFAFRGPGPGFGMGGAFAPRMLLNRRDALDLTDQQVTQLEAMAEQVRDVEHAAADSVRVHAEALHEVMSQDQPDATAVETHARALMAARQRAQLAVVVASARAKATLNDEQRGRVEGWMEGRGMRMRAPAGMRGRGQRPMRRFRRFN